MFYIPINGTFKSSLTPSFASLQREHGRKYSEPSNHWRLAIPHHRSHPLACLADHKILRTVVDGSAEFDATV